MSNLEVLGDLYVDSGGEYDITYEDGSIKKIKLTGGRNHSIHSVIRYEDTGLCDVTFPNGSVIKGYDIRNNGYILGRPETTWVSNSADSADSADSDDFEERQEDSVSEDV